MEVRPEDIIIIANRLKRLKEHGEEGSETYLESTHTLVVLVREYFEVESEDE